MDILNLHDYVFRVSGDLVPMLPEEVYRYLGYRGIVPDETVKKKVEEVLFEAAPLLSPAAILETFPISMAGDEIDLGFTHIKSRDLKRNLQSSEHIILLASTIGARYDIALRKYTRTSAITSAILQAGGAMFIESFLDLLMEEFKKDAEKKGLLLRPRFSPGFGDVPLSMQKDIFRVLRADRIGLTLNDSLLMSPSKSVTAIVGLYKKE